MNLFIKEWTVAEADALGLAIVAETDEWEARIASKINRFQEILDILDLDPESPNPGLVSIATVRAWFRELAMDPAGKPRYDAQL
jgi:hypothetical protein